MKKVLSGMVILGIVWLLAACSGGGPSPTPTSLPLPQTATLSPIPPIQTLTPTAQAILTDQEMTLDKLSPESWDLLYAPFSDEGSKPDNLKFQMKENGLVIENPGTHSGLYAIYKGANWANIKMSVEVKPDGLPPMGVFLICRYRPEGWTQFRISNGSSTLQQVKKQGDSYQVIDSITGPGFSLDDKAALIQVVCNDEDLNLKANDQELISAKTEEVAPGSFGFGVEAFDQAGGRKWFTNGGFDPMGSALAVQAEPEATPVTATYPVVSPEPTQAAPTKIPTLRPTRIAAADLMLYQTQFEDQDTSLKNWRTFAVAMTPLAQSSEDFKTLISTAYYRFQTTQKNQRVFSIYDLDLGTSDVKLSVQLPPPTPREPTQQQTGLVCRYSEAGWYQFMLEPNDMWSVRLAKFDPTGQLHFYKLASGMFYFSREQKLEISAECKGDKLTLLANGQQITSIHDATLPSGRVGLTGWSYTQPGQVSLIKSFSVKRAEWRESDLEGPAPTPDADGQIYTTDFSKQQELEAQWFWVNTHEIGGPGDTSQTLRYINDFDPGTGDVEVSVELINNTMSRALICRYGEDGWYEAFYHKDVVVGNLVGLMRVRRDMNGLLIREALGMVPLANLENRRMSLRCSGSKMSLAVDGQSVVGAQDDLWKTGRYGFSVRGKLPINLRNAFKSYSVRTAPRQEGDTILTETFDHPDLSGWQWNNTMKDAFINEIKDGALYLSPKTYGGGWTALKGFSLRDSETSMDVEFLSKEPTDFTFFCRRSNYHDYIFRINNASHSWKISSITYKLEGYFKEKTGEQVLGEGNSPAIQIDKNHLVFGCEGSQLAFWSNEQQIAAVQDLQYDPKIEGELVIDANPAGQEGPRLVRVDNIKVKLYESDFSSLGNPELLLVMHEIQPGQKVYQTDFKGERIDSTTGGGSNFWAFEATSGARLYQVQPDGLHLKSPEKGNGLFAFYPQELGDLDVEIKAEARLDENNSSMLLFCRANALGRYEFEIRTDGKWSISRGGPINYDYRQPGVILAQGQSTDILSGRNQMTVICQGNTYILMVNGKELARMQDALFVDGQVGFGVGSNSNAIFFQFLVNRAK